MRQLPAVISIVCILAVNIAITAVRAQGADPFETEDQTATSVDFNEDAQLVQEFTQWVRTLDDDPIPTPQDEGDTVWVDGEALRYFLAGLREKVPGLFDEALDSLVGAQLTRMKTGLNISVFFTKAFSIEFSKAGIKPKLGYPKSLDVPREVKMTMTFRDGLLKLSHLDVRGFRPRVKLNTKLQKSTVNLRGFEADLLSGTARVELGIFENWIGVVLRGDIFKRKFGSIDFWRTVITNVRSAVGARH